MICATLKEAKATLNALVDKAVRGEDVILMKGSHHVAAIVPITDDDLTLRRDLTDEQALRLWQKIEGEITSGKARYVSRAAEILQ